MPREITRSLVASVLVALSIPLLAQAPSDVVSTVAAEAEKHSRVMEHLDHLTNEIGPRLTGSERLTKACEWARDQFKSFGIDNARIEKWGEINVGFDRGKDEGFLIAGGSRKPVTFGTNAWTPGTNGMKEGPAILGPVDESGLAEFRSKVKGAWVVRPAKSSVNGDVAKICAEAGALGMVGSAGAELIITSGNHRTSWDDLPKLVRINMPKPEYEALVKSLENGEDLKLAFDVQNRFKEGPIEVYNVIADIPGTEKPEEMVIVGGHIDSWDGATGATDNGTGVATTLEAARLLMKAGAKPRRTIRFMLWSGEEQGLLGSKAWISKHPDELDRISAVLVHDGGTNYVSGIVGMPEMLPALKTAFKPVIEQLGGNVDDVPVESRRSRDSRPAEDRPEKLGFSIRQVDIMPYPIGSDHDSFLAKGVPGFFWRQSGRANYTHTHHTQYDTFDAAIFEYQRHSSKVIALGALGVANLDDKLPRPKNMIREGFSPRRRTLGVQLKGDDDLTIDDVVSESRAEKAGLKPGDKIVKVDGRAVTSRSEMSEALAAGDKKKITYLRGKQEIEVTVEFGAPDSRSREDRQAESQPAR